MTTKPKVKARHAVRPASAKSASTRPADLSHIAPKLRSLAVHVDSIEGYPNNPHKHDENQIRAYRASLREFGQQTPLTVNSSKSPPQVIKGNGLLQAARLEGWTHIAVHQVEMSDQKAAAYVIADNQVSDLSPGWDSYALKAALDTAQVKEQDLGDVLTALAQAEKLLPPVQADEGPEPQIDRADELRRKWGVESGQLWEVPSKSVDGKTHRIMCGDSTDAECVGRLMRGERAGLCLTDPPYNVGFDYGDESRDDRSDKEYEGFCRLWFDIAKKQADVIVFTPGTGRGPGHPNLQLWTRIQWPYWILAWLKKNAVGHSSLGGFNNWEPLFVYGKPPRKIPQDAYDIPITVQADVAAEDGTKLHPVPKQVKLFAALIQDFIAENGLIFEPFSGSGTTFVAAEQLGRLVYGLELEPKYVAVTLQRVADMGLSPRLAS